MSWIEILLAQPAFHRERINALRRYVVEYGWQVQRWRRRKQRPSQANGGGDAAPPASPA